jgi:hypothetical protein
VKDLADVQQLLAHERLSVDHCERGRTTFFSHVGAAPKLVPGAWLGHRDLLYALALANLSPEQRKSLARAVLVDHGREFGVGRLTLQSCPSGLPLGGSSLQLRPRTAGPTCLYTWALAPTAGALPCDWLLLRAQPGWALDAPPNALRPDMIATLDALGFSVMILVATATCARQVADHCLAGLDYTAHPRFLPHLDSRERRAGVVLWPHTAFDPRTFRRPSGHRKQQNSPLAMILVDPPDRLREDVETWLSGQPAAHKTEVATATCPGRADRGDLARLWEACGRPSVLVRGLPEWTAGAAQFLRSLGARAEIQGEGTQLGLFA